MANFSELPGAKLPYYDSALDYLRTRGEDVHLQPSFVEHMRDLVSEEGCFDDLGLPSNLLMRGYSDTVRRRFPFVTHDTSLPFSSFLDTLANLLHVNRFEVRPRHEAERLGVNLDFGIDRTARERAAFRVPMVIRYALGEQALAKVTLVPGSEAIDVAGERGGPFEGSADVCDIEGASTTLKQDIRKITPTFVQNDALCIPYKW